MKNAYVHSRATRGIEHTKLNAGGVSYAAHQTIERIHFLHQISLSCAYARMHQKTANTSMCTKEVLRKGELKYKISVFNNERKKRARKASEKKRARSLRTNASYRWIT